jgi:hypothetical protein
MRSTRLALLASILCLAFVALMPIGARAESWCAYPLWVHEWGVQVFDSSGHAAPVPLPTYFHRSAPTGAGAVASPVRHLPPDSGMRALPVLHFYSGGSLSSPIPVGVEVGFTRGAATHWYPQVDRRSPAATANGAQAQAARRQLVAARAAQNVMGPRQLLGGDPTAQLEWSALALSAQPRHARASTTSPWVGRLRDFDRALWVNGATESERFVFYEADTTESVALALERGPRHGPGRRHYVLRNRSSSAVHDVFFVHREGGALYVFVAPSIPAGATAGFVLEDHRVAPGGEAAGTRDRLRAQLVDASAPSPPREHRWDMSACVMQRDPAVPVDAAEGHRLYAHEVDAILAVWGARFFEQPGTTLVYREDTAYLDRVMPLSIYTDMYNYPLVRRAGLAVWTGVALP